MVEKILLELKSLLVSKRAVATFGAIMIAVGEEYGLPISEEMAGKIIAGLLVWVLGESYRPAMNKLKKAA